MLSLSATGRPKYELSICLVMPRMRVDRTIKQTCSGHYPSNATSHSPTLLTFVLLGEVCECVSFGAKLGYFRLSRINILAPRAGQGG